MGNGIHLLCPDPHLNKSLLHRMPTHSTLEHDSADSTSCIIDGVYLGDFCVMQVAPFAKVHVKNLGAERR